ncbi:uncharacterized protein LAESUDRAFT_721586 [Laetiporus sulphureus 93-53]|uniref:DUF6533 domain-containing protein n=1 Tax=Laetiporus sulphureus 93-53 TaxID=1314785 RepID=A0A165GEU6_9APHY|nr:uncharacterized protein LAESUDRAFT_721586 [Laetiporus sulphureus 93-53]KZT10253.1 hypothetical protein LAESUDRAFT_721586 [Laetiporus sulphureus 93-53]
MHIPLFATSADVRPLLIARSAVDAIRDTPQAASLSQELDSNAASYIRVSAISIAAYDYLVTLPAEWRFYKGQKLLRLSPGCILFILIRYLSVTVLTVGSVGYFGEFSEEECQRYFLVGPIFKVLQTIVSQIILGLRTVNIARRSTWVTWTLLVLFTCVSAAEFLTNLFHRDYVQNTSHNCTGGEHSKYLSTWVYYVLAMFYDVVTLGISTFYLIRYTEPSGRLSELVRLMLYDGIGYFVVLTGVNIFNLLLFRTTDELTQASGTCLGEAVTWIMSQRMLIHLRDAAAERRRVTHNISCRIRSGRSISYAMRSQRESEPKDGHRIDEGLAITNAAEDGHASTVAELADVELNVHVEVEHSVIVECDAHGDGVGAEGTCVHTRRSRTTWVEGGKAPSSTLGTLGC